MNASEVRIQQDRIAAEELSKNLRSTITLAVYDLAALWQRDREAALAIADMSAEAARKGAK